jgi:hypothetical protein
MIAGATATRTASAPARATKTGECTGQAWEQMTQPHKKSQARWRARLLKRLRSSCSNLLHALGCRKKEKKEHKSKSKRHSRSEDRSPSPPPRRRERKSGPAPRCHAWFVQCWCLARSSTVGDLAVRHNNDRKSMHLSAVVMRPRRLRPAAAGRRGAGHGARLCGARHDRPPGGRAAGPSVQRAAGRGPIGPGCAPSTHSQVRTPQELQSLPEAGCRKVEPACSPARPTNQPRPTLPELRLAEPAAAVRA